MVISTLSPTTLLLNNLLINTIGWTILLPAMPVIYAHFDANTATIGTLVSFVAMLTFVCGSLQGMASDYFGRLVMLRICAISQLFGHLVMIYSLHTKSFILFVFARCVPALFKCCMVVSQAFLFDIEFRSNDNKPSNLGTLYAYSNLAFIIGPLIGGFSVSRSMYYPNILGFVIACIEIAMMSYMKELPSHKNIDQHSVPNTDADYSADYTEILSTDNDAGFGLAAMERYNHSASSPLPPSPPSSSQPPLLSPRLSHLLHVKFAFQLSNSLFEALFPQYGRNEYGLAGSMTGLLFSLSGGLSALTNMFLLKWVLAAHLRVEEMLLVCLSATALGLYVWALWSSVNGLLVAMVIITISSNLFQGVVQSAISACMKDESASSTSTSSYARSEVVDIEGHHASPQADC